MRERYDSSREMGDIETDAKLYVLVGFFNREGNPTLWWENTRKKKTRCADDNKMENSLRLEMFD